MPGYARSGLVYILSQYLALDLGRERVSSVRPGTDRSVWACRFAAFRRPGEDSPGPGTAEPRAQNKRVVSGWNRFAMRITTIPPVRLDYYMDGRVEVG